MSAEKQGPSPVQIVAELQHAIDLQRRQTHSKNTPLRDMLNKIVAEYNRFASNKKHRLDSARKALALNLTLGKSLALLCLFQMVCISLGFSNLVQLH